MRMPLEKLNRELREHRRTLRLLLIGFAVSCVIWYPLLIVAKLGWGLNQDWLQVILKPVIYFGPPIWLFGKLYQQALKEAQQLDDIA
jgi:hypothetical protein